ncbi:cohesin domain-containing protein [Methanococcoides methylutens]|uniref:EF hand domain/PKD domain protein n=1 Tax=Methanococcoides methylutens MM1 TaxID=1434104 RepID=A0A0E3WZY2_METMT|nr:cohesin domain-containing protein [Methanococcoides methylutens]AKB85439.1 EF hand domain/PKD domain protein [Methanococcoides methylutens MM1]
MFGIKKFLIVAAMFALFAATANVSAAASDVTLEPSSQIVTPGDTFTVNIFVSPDVDIAGMQFDLVFDSSQFQVSEASEGSLFKQSGMDTFFVAGSVNSGLLNDAYGCILGASDVATPANFASVTVTATEQSNGRSELVLKDVIISDPSGNAVDIELTNAVISVVIVDINQDGVVDFEDYGLVEQHFDETTSYPYPSWDVNQDDIVNVLDLMLVLSHMD